MAEDKREILHKEIDIIQGCINRMASNSFLIKGWFITLFLGVFTFGYDKINIITLIIILGILSIVAWLSDAYFLQLERKYRKKYEWVIANRMISDNYLYNLNPEEKSMRSNEKNISFKDVFFSKTLIITYCFPMFIYFLIKDKY